MDKQLYDAFDRIHAEDALKDKTLAILREETFRREQPRRIRPLKMAVACMSLMLMFVVGKSTHMLYMTPSAYLDIDVNPSIELTLNRFDRVLAVKPYNDDGELVLKDVNVLHKTYEDAVQSLIDAMIIDGYLEQDGLVTATVQTSNGAVEHTLLAKTQIAVTNALSSHHVRAEYDAFPVTADIKANAGENAITPAKYLAILDLQQVDPTTTIKECAEHSISEIRQLTMEHEQDHHAENAEEIEVHAEPIVPGDSATFEDETIPEDQAIPKDAPEQTESSSSAQSNDSQVESGSSHNGNSTKSKKHDKNRHRGKHN